VVLTGSLRGVEGMEETGSNLRKRKRGAVKEGRRGEVNSDAKLLSNHLNRCRNLSAVAAAWNLSGPGPLA